MYVYAALLLGFVLLPLLIIVPMSLTSGTNLTFPTPGYSLRWYHELVADPRWIASFKNSVVIATAATLLSCILGIPAAIGLVWAEFPGKRLILAIIATPLVVPVVIVGVSAYSFFASVGLASSKWGIILTHTAMAVPVLITTVSASLNGFDRTLLRAAASLGAGPTRTFFRIILPLIAPGVLSGAIIAFIISFDEVVVASFMSTGEERTLPRMIFSGVRESLSPAIASLAVVLVVISGVLLGIVGFFQARANRLHKQGVT